MITQSYNDHMNCAHINKLATT